MSGFIVLQDDRAWMASNSVFDSVIETLAIALGAAEGDEFALWLLSRRSRIEGPGMGVVDLRELAPQHQ